MSIKTQYTLISVYEKDGKSIPIPLYFEGIPDKGVYSSISEAEEHLYLYKNKFPELDIKILKETSYFVDRSSTDPFTKMFNLICALSDNLRDSILEQLPKMPDHWDGFEIRWLFMEKARSQIFVLPAGQTKRNKRFKDFINYILVNSF